MKMGVLGGDTTASRDAQQHGEGEDACLVRSRAVPKGRGLKAMARGLDFMLRTMERGSVCLSAEGSVRGAELSKANGAGGRLGVCGPGCVLSSDH